MTAALALFFFAAAGPVERAVDFLAAEVPRWRRENGCYSCHNNGDGARALYAAARRGYPIPGIALEDSTGWLAAPRGWDHNPGAPGFNNARLGRIQFASALREAVASGFAARSALTEAARMVAKDQDTDGSWKVDTGGAPGAPATYGTALATYMARRVLEAAGGREFARSIARANRWFAAAAAANFMEAAIGLLAARGAEPERRRCLDTLIAGQTSDGGWGPLTGSPAEPFDTALAIVALHAAGQPERTGKAVARGRAWLMARQDPDGSWLETTRPAGQISYAEHISTTAWALYALLATGARSE